MSPRKILSSPWTLGIVYTLAAVATALQRISFGFDEKGYSRYENYRIFKFSWHYFIEGQNPYAGHPETWDLYKYSPAFSALMAPFYALPDIIGLPLWNIANALPLLLAILCYPHLRPQSRIYMAWLVLPELVIALQNTQSNGLMAALFLLTGVSLERNRAFRAAAWIMCGAFIKIFGIFAAVQAIAYPKHWFKLGIALGIWGIFLAFSPALLIGWQVLEQNYIWWWELLQNDHAASVGLSFSGWLKTWFNLSPDKTMLTLGAVIIQIGAGWWVLLKKQSTIPLMASILIWVVIFNHKAESPTFIIAICGAALWYFSLKNANLLDHLCIISCFVLASLTPTDLFPRSIYHNWIQPYTIKAVPFILLWTVIMIDIFRNEQRTDLEIS